MTNTAKVWLLLIFYFTLLLGLAPINLLSFDTYYYWEWSRHLALSYYDGSPMIAYLIKLSRTLFGDTLFSLSFVGILVSALTSGILYKTARLFLSPKASCITLFSFLFSPLLTMDVLTQTTYDTPLILFWALTLYYSVKFIRTGQINALYFLGIAAGLMMLSKYTGIVLLFSLLIFLPLSPYRLLFKTKHFYAAIGLSLLIFSPVLIWNYQHQWQSFIYQLTSHQIHKSINPVKSLFSTLFTCFIPALNVLLITPFLKNPFEPDTNIALIIRLCRIISITFLAFYVLLSTKAGIRIYWLTPYLISTTLILGYYCEKGLWVRWGLALTVVYATISIGIFFDNTLKFNILASKRVTFYHLIQKFNQDYPHPPQPILTSGWFSARMLYFLKQKPEVYTLGCGTDQNQYKFWSQDIQKKIATKALKEALYLDHYDRSDCLKQYFKHCTRLPTRDFTFKHNQYNLYAYHCSND